MISSAHEMIDVEKYEVLSGWTIRAPMRNFLSTSVESFIQNNHPVRVAKSEYQYSKGRKGAWQNLKRTNYQQVKEWTDTHAK